MGPNAPLNRLHRPAESDDQLQRCRPIAIGSPFRLCLHRHDI
jgi:hypothetical protein